MTVNIVERVDDAVRVRLVLASVSNKAGLERLIPGLLRVNPALRILSTGGTFSAIEALLGPRAAGCLKQVSDYTGQPEMQGGLVKTLDFKIYLGLLSETHNPAHTEDLRRAGAEPIDLVVVNLYPFVETIRRSDCTLEMARANVDIGGPCMVRAAAKNFLRVACVTDPADYDALLKELEQSGGLISLRTRFALAQKAFAHTAAYDAAIARYLKDCSYEAATACYRLMPGGGGHV